MGLQHFNEPLCAEQLIADVGRLRDAVGVAEQLGAWLQLQLIRTIFNALHRADDQPVPVFEQLKVLPGFFQYRVLMTGTGSSKLSR